MRNAFSTEKIMNDPQLRETAKKMVHDPSIGEQLKDQFKRMLPNMGPQIDMIAPLIIQNATEVGKKLLAQEANEQTSAKNTNTYS